MKNTEEIIAFLDAELEDAWKRYKDWEDKDEEEAFKYIVTAHVIEYILDEIDEPEEKEMPKILTEMPKEPKPKRTLTYYFVHVLSAIAFIVSWFTIDGLIFDFVDRFSFLSGVASALIHYGYLLIHFGAYLFLIAYLHNTDD